MLKSVGAISPETILDEFELFAAPFSKLLEEISEDITFSCKSSIQKPDIDRAAKRISITGSAAAIGSVASIMTNTWWIDALMGLGVRHYLYKEWTPSVDNTKKSPQQIVYDLKHASEVKELSKKIELLEIERNDIFELKMKAAKSDATIDTNHKWA